MEINQGSSVNRDLIKSVGNNLNKIGNLYFVILVANGFIFYLISDFKNINESIGLIKFLSFVILIVSIFIIFLFKQSGIRLIKSVVNSIVIHRQLFTGEIMTIVFKSKDIIGSNVFIDYKSVKDGSYEYKTETNDHLSLKLIVRDGEVIEKYYIEKVENYIFEKKGKYLPKFGDKVFLLDNKVPNNGKIKYNKNKYFYIENGVIIK